MTYVTRFLRSLVWLVLFVLAIPVVVLLVLQVPAGQALLSGVLSSLASSDKRTVSVEGLSIGLGLSQIRVAAVELADENGVWFDARSLAVDWRPLELLTGTASISEIRAGEILLARLPNPAPDDGQDPPPPSADGSPLPGIGLTVDRVDLKDVSLGAPVIGTDVSIAVSGAARLIPDPLVLSASLDVQRIDGIQGAISADLEFAPEAEQLSFDLDVDEPRDGLIANLLQVEGLPGLTAKLTGSGPLTDWAASLSLALDRQPTVSGTARLTSDAQQRQLTFDLDGQIEPLMPPEAAAFFLGTTDIAGTARFSADFKPLAADLKLSTGTLNLTANAVTDQDFSRFDGSMDLDVSAGGGALIAVDMGDRRVAFGPARIETRLAGRRDAADWSLSLTAGRVQTAEGHFEAANLTISGKGANLTPETLASDFSVKLDVSGVSAAMPELAALNGGIGLEATGRLARRPLLAELTHAQVTTSAATLILDGASATPTEANAQGKLQVANLKSFEDLAGLPLTGALATTFNVAGNPRDLTLTADLSTAARGLSSGIAAVDGLLGPEPRLSFRVTGNQLSSLDLENLSLTSAGLILNGSGEYENASLDSQFDAQLPDLSRIDPQLSGKLAFDLSLNGPFDGLSVDLEGNSAEILLAGTALKDLRIDLDARAQAVAPQGSLSVTARLGDLPLSIEADVESADGTTRIEPLEALLGSNRATGGFTIGDTGRVLETLTGSIEINAPQLGELSPLLLTDIGGALSGSIKAVGDDSGSRLTADLSGTKIRGPGFDLASTRLTFALPAPFDPAALQADVSVDDLLAGGQPIHKITLSARPGPQATALNAEIRLSAGGSSDGLSLAGDLSTIEGGYRLALSQLNGRYQRLTTRLAEPATVDIQDQAVAIPQLALALGDGRLTVSGQAGETLDMKADLSRVPLSLVNAVQPGLGLGGTLSGQITATGSADNPAAAWSITGAGLTAAPLRDNGIPALELTTKGSMRSSRIELTTGVSGPSGLGVTATGALGLADRQAIDISLEGAVPLALARRQLTEAGLRATGTMSIKGRVGGTLAAPLYSIDALPQDVSVTGLSTGFTVRNVTGSVSANQDTIAIKDIRADIATGGTLSASGTVGLGDEMPADISARIDQGRYIQAGLVNALVDAGLSVSGPLASPSRSALISGTVTINKADISVPETLAGAVSPVAVRHINAPPAVRKQVAELGGDKADRPASGSQAQPPRLDVTLSAPGRIFVRGRGLDAELQGNLRIVGTTAEPQAIGSFNLRRGQFNILTRRLQFSSGSATFNGSLTPDLAFTATTSVRGTQITVTVSGPADDPAIAFTSAPELPQDEVLALLLFGKEMGNLSPAQIAQLAGSIATLTGGSDNGPLAAVRRSLGLDVVDVNTDGEGGPSLAVGKYINDNIYLGVEQGAGSESSRVQVDIELDRGLKLRGEVGADGSSKAGIFFEREY
ncbi:DUF490 domain-containing protein [Roseibium aquae]|uniref:DUF490 domain-containing protein n=1 Tax=Roseibium aquae TaxID=1323746 RepID=A0A916TKI4_9HYPH|nr:translocation/assembly module TamB domain-containing protein [Roseibium aquae]GGB48947.1 DUF490 domain-containing protein [Roseibium aquae]